MAVIESKGDGYALYNGVKVLASEVPEGAESIPLDGMNVIEWDGNTEGLEILPEGTGYYHVSSTTNINVDKSVIVSRKSVDYIRSLSKDEGYYRAGVEARIVITESELFPTVGVFLKSSTAYTTSLFAYYPIEQEPEEPELSRSQLLLLSRMFSPAVFHALTGKWHWYD